MKNIRKDFLKYLISFIVGSWFILVLNYFAPYLGWHDNYNAGRIEITDSVNSFLVDSVAGVVNQNGQYSIPKEIVLDNNGIIVLGKNNQSYIDSIHKVQNFDRNISYLNLSTNFNPVYWRIHYQYNQAMWYYSVNIRELNGIGITIDFIKESIVMANLEPSIIIHEADELKSWWGSNYIAANSEKKITTGMNTQLVSYTVWEIFGTDDKGNSLEFRYIVSLSQYELDYNISVPKTDINFDTVNLYHNADFEREVFENVYWVPANSLGKSDLDNSEIASMLNESPEFKKQKIDTLYEAIQLFQISNFKGLDIGANIHESIGSVDWEYHIPGEIAVTLNNGDCSTNSNWLNYILQGDYDEVGFISYSQLDGNGHVFNYIKHQGYYYFIDLTHYRMDFINYRGIESGKLGTYLESDIVASNIHRVKDIIDYIYYILSVFNDPPELMSMYTAQNTLDIGISKKNNQTIIYYPNDTKVDIILDNLNDSVRYEFIAHTSKSHDFNFITSNPTISALPFN